MGFGDRFTLAALAAEIGLPMRVDAPVSGDDAHRVPVMLRNGRGQLEAPDSDLLYLRVLDNEGAALTRLYVASDLAVALTNSASGDFPSGSGWKQLAGSAGEFASFLKVSAADEQAGIVIEVGWKEQGRAGKDLRRLYVGEAGTLGEDVDAQWDEAKAGHVAAGSFGKSIGDTETNVGSEADGSSASGSAHAKIKDVKAAVVAIGGAAGVADAVWDEAEAGHVAAGSTGLALKDARDASVLTQINLGDPSGAPPGFTNLADLIGAPDDAAVDPDAANGTLYAYLKKAIADLRAVGVSGGAAQAEIKEYPWQSATATLTADPTETEIDADGTATDPGGVPPFEILDVIDVNFPEGVGMTSEAVIKSIFATLKWTSQITTGVGTGLTKWGIDSLANTDAVGEAPDAGVTFITDVIAASTSKTTHQRAGLVRTDVIEASGGFRLFLCGKCGTADEVLTCTIFNSTNLEINYKRI